jgi:hypothetical protein
MDTLVDSERQAGKKRCDFHRMRDLSVEVMVLVEQKEDEDAGLLVLWRTFRIDLLL